MSQSATFPFELRRGEDILGLEVVSKRETIHGLLRVEGDRLLIQWRLTRTTERVGWEIRKDEELEPVREAVMPLAALRSANVQWEWLRWPPGPYLVLTAADLRAFEKIAGEDGLRLKHPAELAIRLTRGSRIAARLFASELELALADRALVSAFDQEQRLQPGARTEELPDGARRLESPTSRSDTQPGPQPGS